MKTMMSWLCGGVLALGAVQAVHAITPVEPIAQQKQVAGFYQHQFGPYQITALLDGTNHVSRALFKGVSEREMDVVLQKYHANQAKGIQTSVNAFLINTGDELSLVDSGAASCFGPHLGSIYQNLQAAGFKPAQVSHVYLTHLHPDHVCGISDQGRALYPHATLHIAKKEYDFWMSPQTAQTIPEANRSKFLDTVTTIKAALAPYEQAGRIQWFDDQATEVGPLKLKPSYGHTPGHQSFVLQHADQELVFIGDIVHSHTIQFEKPNTAIEFDIDPKQAVQTRLQHFAQYAKQGQTIAAPHLPFPGIGHIHAVDKDRYQWIPIHFQD